MAADSLMEPLAKQKFNSDGDNLYFFPLLFNLFFIVAHIFNMEYNR